MGVYGLWRLLDPTGKPVPLETLEGKILAIDVSIWIHQVLQGYQDRNGNPKPNAHLLGLFHRICKLLYYKIKPVFVFDGGVPMLKKNTIASRRKQKSIAASKAQKMKTDLINNLIKHTAVKTILNKDNSNVESGPSQISANIHNKPFIHDMFKLPDIPDNNRIQPLLSDDEYNSDSSVEISPRKQTKWMGNIHSVDVTSAEFKALPADVRYDILTDLKETRKQSSWGRLHEMPDESHNFSSFQMKRLLKRRLVQESLESAEKEMGGKTLTLDELDKLLTEQGINTKDGDTAYRIAADSTTRLIYISDKNAMVENVKEGNAIERSSTNYTDETVEPVAGPSKPVSILENIKEYELDDDWNSDIEVTNVESIGEYELNDEWESDTEMNESRPLSKKYFGKNTMNPALTYMLEHSGLTQEQIITLIEQSKKDNRKTSEKSSKSSHKQHSRKRDIQKTIQKSETVSRIDKEDTRLNGQTKEINATEDKIILEKSPECISLKSESESDDFDKVNDNAKPKKQIFSEIRVSPTDKIDKVSNEDTTDSDTEDFIEIQDVPIPNTYVTQSETERCMEITIKSDQNMEDDMFADIFEISNKGLTIFVDTAKKDTQSEELKNKYSQRPNDKACSNDSRSPLEVIPEEITIQEKLVINPRESGVENQLSTIENKQDSNNSKNSNNDDNINTSIDTKETEVPVSDNPVKPLVLPVRDDELLSLKEHLEDEQKELNDNIGKLERQGTDISDQIRIEAQELLKLFGIPYIVAPMEAEAQCAYLEQVNLTNGTITDDSDIWLFGGQCVYKNFFNNNKRVLRFRLCDIQHHFKLTRHQMIQLALLVGSDYTAGLNGIGPVTALEILAAFPTEGDNLLRGLNNFCSWIKSGKTPGPGKTTLRNKLKNIHIEKGFPSQAVVQAYMFPTIDESKEGFTWGKPNVILLSDYARMKFGWGKSRFDEVMNPVIKRLEETKNQRAIDSYFNVQATPKSIEPNLSKRIQNAIHRLKNDDVEESVEIQQKSNSRATKRKSKKEQKEETNLNVLENTTSDHSVSIPNTTENSIKDTEERILQREKDKANALKKKLHAIEVFRKSKQGLAKTKRVKRSAPKIMKEAKLSESDSSSS